VSQMPSAVASHGFTHSCDGATLYVVGGTDGSYFKQCWSYDLVGGKGWLRLADLPYGMGGAGCFCYGGGGGGDWGLVFCSVYCQGSREGGVFVLDLIGGGVDVWTRVGNVTIGAEYLQAFRWRDDRAVILGRKGQAWKVKLGENVSLEKLNLSEKMFTCRAGFCLDGEVVAVLGDQGQWNKINTKILI